jgi:AraC-like DNA-binding protein
MATYLTALPPPSLRRFVDHLSYWEDGTPEAGAVAKTAGRAASIQIDLADDALAWWDPDGRRHDLPGVAVAGPQRRPFAVPAWQPRLVRIVFRPAGFGGVFGGGLGELADRHVPLADIWGRAAARLQDALATAPSPSALFERLGGGLLAAAAARGRALHPVIAVALARAERGAQTAAELAEDSGLTRKGFIRLFKAEVGLTPKLYLRIARFERLAQRLPHGASAWAELAADEGYFDQSHLIRDFRSFAGATPTTFEAQSAQPVPRAFLNTEDRPF